MRFVMELSLAASDTILAGGDPVAGTRKKSDEPFRNNLKALYRQIGPPIDGGKREEILR
jgi:salicylate hydroxylase